MKNRINEGLIALIEGMLVLTVIFWVVGSYAHDKRIFVEIEVEDYLDGVGTDYTVAMEFIDAIDFEGLEKLELPDSTCIDPDVLKGFIPRALFGNKNYIEIFDYDEKEATGPTVRHSLLKGERADCFAFVGFTREDEGEGNFETIRIEIWDRGVYGSNRFKYDITDENVEMDTIKGYEAAIRRALDEGVGGQGTLGISIAVGPLGLDWNEILEAAKEGVREGVKKWSCTARFTSGSINGSVLIIPPGSLESTCFSEAIIDEITAVGTPAQIAIAFAGGVWLGWKQWSSTFNGTFGNAFPSFSSFPGPSAPPTPAIPLPVISADADREKLSAAELGSQILSLLGEWEEDPDAQKAVEEFAQWFDKCFTEAVSKSQIVSLYGQGPVPSYAPPKVPVGPVVDGEIIASPVVFANFEF